MEIKEYKKSLEDEIDWKIIDQLHSVTTNFSNSSLELKKLFFVLIGIAVPSLIKLADDRLDPSLFITLYILTITFWSLDSLTYFYQEKLREKMDMLFNQIKTRNKGGIIVSGDQKEGFTIENTRTGKGRFWRSISNPSVRLYIILLGINTFVTTLYYCNIIR